MTSNPSVNRYLKNEAMDHIDHALGRPIDPMGECYRNHFAADKDGRDAASFRASPHWHLDGCLGRMAFYSVTDEGRKALAQHLKEVGDPWKPYDVTFDGFTSRVSAMSAGNAKYQKYLDISDCRPSLTFGRFAREATVRRVAA